MAAGEETLLALRARTKHLLRDATAMKTPTAARKRASDVSAREKRLSLAHLRQ